MDDSFQFATATKKNSSNNMKSLTLQVDGPITERAYIGGGGGGYNRVIFSVYRLMGLQPGGLKSGGVYKWDFTAYELITLW